MSIVKMKTIVLTLFLIMTSFVAYGKWDASTCSYTDYKWHFHWNLDKELEWEKVQGNERHTVFAALSPYGLMVYVNIKPLTETQQYNLDYWEHFEDYKHILQESWKQVEQRTGGSITPIKIEKCRFFGEKAVKVIVKTTLTDDIHNETSYGITYTFHKDGSTWNANVKATDENWKILGEDGLKGIFLNFGPNAK